MKDWFERKERELRDDSLAISYQGLQFRARVYLRDDYDCLVADIYIKMDPDGPPVDGKHGIKAMPDELIFKGLFPDYYDTSSWSLAIERCIDDHIAKALASHNKYCQCQVCRQTNLNPYDVKLEETDDADN